MSHKDYFERELEVGDCIVKSGFGGDLLCCKVVGFSSGMVRIKSLEAKRPKAKLAYGVDLIKVDSALVTYKMLKKEK